MNCGEWWSVNLYDLVSVLAQYVLCLQHRPRWLLIPFHVLKATICAAEPDFNSGTLLASAENSRSEGVKDILCSTNSFVLQESWRNGWGDSPNIWCSYFSLLNGRAFPDCSWKPARVADAAATTMLWQASASVFCYEINGKVWLTSGPTFFEVHILFLLVDC